MSSIRLLLLIRNSPFYSTECVSHSQFDKLAFNCAIHFLLEAALKYWVKSLVICEYYTSQLFLLA